jgi:hypothetical protein
VIGLSDSFDDASKKLTTCCLFLRLFRKYKTVT